jgi:anti-sigma regulatory factor (Ser/Thr protein kinase)
MTREPSSPTFTALELTLAARPENIPVARQAVGAMLGPRISPNLLGDVKTALTEACMNAVVHAYPDAGEGEFQVSVLLEPERVTIEVRDWGVGIQPRPLESTPGLRIGLPLIAALTDDFEIRSGTEGTSVMLCFDLQRAGEPEGPQEPAPARAADETVVSLRSTAGTTPSFAPALTMLAARSDLSVDRLSDLQVLGDLLGSAGTRSPDGLRLSVREDGEGLAIRVGPLPPGGAQSVVRRGALPALGNIFDRLADRWEIEDAADGETLVLEIGGGVERARERSARSE